ncbi:MAG: DUF1926 domain-containing protein, partial [Elusimicrobia bacterium]|nr:DUF1926 domain-containing protein [Elusimicrobiota bacterium]
GNFKWVFEKGYKVAYKPFIDVMSKHKSIKWNLHSSGMLWEFMAQNHPAYIKTIKKMVSSGKVELISGGYYEPILSVIPSVDRYGQIRQLSNFIKNTFDYEPQGAWVAERVWEPSLVKDFANAGIKYTILDDVHFMASGLKENDLKGYYVTEDEGKILNVFPISQRLRYLIPFQNVEVCIDYFKQLANEDKDIVVVMADDGEKFGMWPGTDKHVYENGWLDKFLTALEENSDIVETATFSQVLKENKPSGRIYLQTNSYFEMSEWSLPSSVQSDFDNFVRANEFKPEFKPFIRGGFWRNFLSKYDEVNNMHKKMIRVSKKLQDKKVDVSSDIQKELYSGQCNCAYWHGVFGGLYLPHLRNAIYEHLLKAENLYNKKFSSENDWIETDFDCDNTNEFLYESENQNIYVDAENGGSIFEFDILRKNYNLSNVLTRRYEGYHKKLKEAIENNKVVDSKEFTSIHTDAVKVKELGLEKHLVYDWYRKTSLLDHFFSNDTAYEQLYGVHFREQGDFILGVYNAKIINDGIQLSRQGHVWYNNEHLPVEVIKTIKPLNAEGYTVEYKVKNLSDANMTFSFGVEQVFAFSERTAADEVEIKNKKIWKRKDKNLKLETIVTSSLNCDYWVCPIETVSTSDSGYEKTYQGTTVVNVYKFSLNKDEEFKFKIKTEIRG